MADLQGQPPVGLREGPRPGSRESKFTETSPNSRWRPNASFSEVVSLPPVSRGRGYEFLVRVYSTSFVVRRRRQGP